MKRIDKTATRILDQLVEMLRAHIRQAMKLGKAFPESKTINNAPKQFKPVTIEFLGTVSLGPLLCVAHYKLLENSQTLCDPKMVFLHTLKSYYPVAYQHDSLEIYRESVKFKGSNLVSVIPKLQHWQAEFANRWLKQVEREQEV